MNKQQEKLYNALLEQNELARSSNEPFISDTESTARAFSRIVSLLDMASAADVCAWIEGPTFENDLLDDAREAAQDKRKYSRMDSVLFQIYFLTSPNADSKKLWNAIQGALYLINHDHADEFVIGAQQKALNFMPEFFRGPRQITHTDNGTFMEEFSYKVPGSRQEYQYRVLNSDSHNLRITTLMLFHFLKQTYAANRQADCKIPLKKYAELRGFDWNNKNDRDTVRIQVQEDLFALRDCELFYVEKRKRAKFKPAGFFRFWGGTAEVNNNTIHWSWNVSFLPELEDVSGIDEHISDFLLDPRGSAFPFAKYIEKNYRLNEGEPRCEVITIRKLLEVASTRLPSYEKLEKDPGRPSIKNRLIKPFFRDLNSISWLIYLVYTADDIPVNDPLSMSPSDFINGYIKVNYDMFPPHKDRLNAKNKHIAEKKKIIAAAKKANAVKSALAEQGQDSKNAK